MKEVSKYIVSPTKTIRETIEIIERSSVQIALVVDSDRRLKGTVTDGDIRRALLRGETLETPIACVMQQKFRYLPETATEEEALAIMRRDLLHQIPVLDKQGRVVHLHLLDELNKPRTSSNPVVIMAGGKGKRLRPLTQDCPKPMLRVGNQPLLELILKQCIEFGFNEFYFAVNYLKHQIQDYFEDGSRWHIKIHYLEEEQPLGTAGALSLLPHKPSEPLLVLNGDILTRVDYTRLLSFHHEHDSAATLCVREHYTQIPYGVVQLDDIDVRSFDEKPVLSHYVNAGIYLIEPGLLDHVPQDCFLDMPQLLEITIQQGKQVSAFPIHEYWLDVGLPETLERANGEWQKF